MHIVITGANGYVGRGLVRRLQQTGQLGDRGQRITRLSLLDLTFDGAEPQSGIVHRFAGDLTDRDWVESVLSAAPLDVVFHLASVPGGAAEQQYELARAVNLGATETLLELGKTQVEAGRHAPVFVFASTIAVYGEFPAHVTDDTPLRPQMTYGAQKLIGEVLVDDFSRRGWVDGRSLRLPGVLARPPARTGQLSAFLSDIIRELAAGRPFVCPTSPGATTWASSLGSVVDNLVHAAQVRADQLGGRRTFALPTQCFSMEELVAAIADVYHTDAQALVSWQPDERIENLFGRFPTLETPAADAAGFCKDRDLKTLVDRALSND